MGLDWLLDNEWHLLLDVEGDLNLNWLNFCLVDLYFLVFYAISVDFNWHLFDDLVRHQFLDFNLDYFLHLNP